jgi:hypothetical protein
VNRLGAGAVGDLEQLLHHQVALRRGTRPQQEGLVGAAGVRGVAVGLRVDRHGGHAQLLERAHDADRDLPAIGDQDLREHGRERLLPRLTGTSAVSSAIKH